MTRATQKREVNSFVRDSNDVKVIVAPDGSVQVVDINATNVNDGNPDVKPYVEIKGSKRVTGVQQREVAIDVNDNDATDVLIASEPTTHDEAPKADEPVVETAKPKKVTAKSTKSKASDESAKTDAEESEK